MILLYISLISKLILFDDSIENELKKIQAYHRINSHLASSGNLSDANIATIKEAGFEHMINLVPGNYFKEKTTVEAAGLSYLQIQVNFRTPTEADLNTFFESMKKNEGKKIFVHCQANLRASSFVFLYRVLKLKIEMNEARKDLTTVWYPSIQWDKLIVESLEKNGKNSDYLNESDLIKKARHGNIEPLQSAYKKNGNAEEKLFNQRLLMSIAMKFMNDDPEYTIKVFTLNTDAYPEDWSAYDNLGNAIMQTDNIERALPVYQKLAKNQPENIWYKRMLGKLGQSDFKIFWTGVELEESSLKPYVGSYDMGRNFIIDFKIETGKLLLNTSGNIKDVKLRSDNETTFFRPDRSWKFVFKDIENGKAQSVDLFFGGSDARSGKRVESD